MPPRRKSLDGGESAPLFDRLAAALEKISPLRRVQDCQHFLPSGAFPLDMVLANGRGWPLGRIVEVYGSTHSGKTTLALTTGGQAQRAGGCFVYIAMEPYIIDNATWVRRCGADPATVLMERPRSLEEALEVTEKAVEMAVEADVPTVIAFGSIAAAGTERRLKDGGEGPAEAARLLSESFRGDYFRKLQGSKVLLILENQLKQTMMGHMGGGPQDSTYGGLATEFNASIRLKVQRGIYRIGDAVLGSFANIQATKNNHCGAGRACSLVILHEAAISELESVMCALRPPQKDAPALLPVAGSWISLGSHKCQGWAEVRKLLEQDAEGAWDAARNAIYASYNRIGGLLG